MTNTVPLIHLVRHRQLKFLGHIIRMSKEEPARRYALYIPTIGKRRPGRPRTSYLNYVQRLLGDNEGAMQEQQIAAFADDRRAWRNLVIACSAADGWWWFNVLWETLETKRWSGLYCYDVLFPFQSCTANIFKLYHFFVCYECNLFSELGKGVLIVFFGGFSFIFLYLSTNGKNIWSSQSKEVEEI